MAHLIDKDALVAEIDKFKENANKRGAIGKASTIVLCNEFLSFIDTLEVKDEVDSSHPIKAMKDALRMEYEKGRADVLRCIDPDVMVADFCSQPLSKTRSLASIYRQGIIDIIKRINNNEETDINNTHSIDDGGVHRA